jgi:hypothetical protein
MTFVRAFGPILLTVLLPVLSLAQGSARADEIAVLREQIAAQQKQLDQQREALNAAQKALASSQAAIDSQQKLLDGLEAARTARPAGSPRPVAPPPRGPATPSVEAANQAAVASPLSFRIGGAEFAPGGFMDMSTAWRSTNIGSGVATSFAGVPMGNTAAGRMQEFRSSAANSRLTLTITEKPTPNSSLTAYVEGDFTGNNPAGVYVTSNSNTLRMRHFWLDVVRKKWEIVGGQTWTLLTPNRFALSPVSSNIFVGQGEDSNYMPGLVWGRPGQIRVVYHPNEKWSIGAAVENPEQFVTTATTLPAFAATQVDNGSVPSIPNARPDYVAKIAYDTRVSGKAMHLELGGFSRRFRTSPAPGKYYNAAGFGGVGDAILEVAKNFRVIVTGFYSSGGGRYLALAPDLIVGPDGSISPVHAMSGIAGLEYAPNAKSQFFAYFAGAYFDRNYVRLGPGNYLGFGFPGSSSANRAYQEPQFGYYYTIWKNPRFGALQVISEYAYLIRAPWSVPAGTPSKAHAHMIFSSLRFTLPQGGGQAPAVRR